MKKYLGVKLIEAKPMILGLYNDFRGWSMPTDEDAKESGYLVKYEDGYISWSPKKQFDEAYREIEDLTFGLAIEAVKKGLKIARKGWNGKNMFVVYQKGYPDGIPSNRQTAEARGINEGDLFIVRPYLQLKTADGSHAMWSPSTSDCLAEDWVIVE
jgi:hypothetical protein